MDYVISTKTKRRRKKYKKRNKHFVNSNTHKTKKTNLINRNTSCNIFRDCINRQRILLKNFEVNY